VEGRLDELNFYNEIQASQLGGFIENLGDLGFMRMGGPRITQRVFTQAWEEDAISLDFYRTYYYANQSFYVPKKFFASIYELKNEELLECSEWEGLWVGTSIRISNWVEKYIGISGDMDGFPDALRAIGGWRPPAVAARRCASRC